MYERRSRTRREIGGSVDAFAPLLPGLEFAQGLGKASLGWTCAWRRHELARWFDSSAVGSVGSTYLN